MIFCFLFVCSLRLKLPPWSTPLPRLQIRPTEPNDNTVHKIRLFHFPVMDCTPLRLGFLILINSLKHWKGDGKLSVLMLCAHVFISVYIRQFSSFRVPILWFIDLTVATCDIQYTSLSQCQFHSRENGQNTKMAADVLLGAQSINTVRASLM